MDGHSSHVNINFVEFCWAYKIIPICLPPHSTHFLQPLNLVIFLVLKRLYSSKVDEYAVEGVTGINREWFLKILGEIRPQVYTTELINSAFEAAGLLPYNPERALNRYSRTPLSQQPSTPPPSDAPVTLLSSPLHPRTPQSYNDRARYAYTILYPKTTPEAAKAVISKLMQRLQSLEEGIELMEVEAAKLRNNTVERNKKKQRKRTVLSTTSVLTTQAMQAIATAKNIAEEDKKQAKVARDQAKIQRQAAAVVAKEQLEARKEARTAAAKLRKVAD